MVFFFRKKVVIHVPFKIKNVKHTHTVYKLVPNTHLSKREDLAKNNNEEFDHYKK